MKKNWAEIVWDLLLAGLVLFALLGGKFAHAEYYSYPGPGVSAYTSTAFLPTYASDGTLAVVGTGSGTYTLYTFKSSVPAWVAIGSTSPSGTLPVANGGTGVTSLTGYGALVMNSAGTQVTSVAPGTSGNGLTSNGTNWISSAPAMKQILCQMVSGSSTTSVTFSSIPQTYNQLKLYIVADSANSASAADGIQIQFNGDSAADYTSIAFFASQSGSQGSGAGLVNTSGQFAEAGPTGSVAAYTEAQIPFYANATWYKGYTATSVNFNGTGTYFFKGFSGIWNSTSAITSITLTLASGSNFVANSEFCLYGIN